MKRKFKWWYIVLISIVVVVIGGLVNSGIPLSIFRCNTPEEAFKLINHDYKEIKKVLYQGDAALLVYSTKEDMRTEVVEKDAKGWIPPGRLFASPKHFLILNNNWIIHDRYNYDNIIITGSVLSEGIAISDSCDSDFQHYDEGLGFEWYFTSMKELPKDYKLYIDDQTVTLD